MLHIAKRQLVAGFSDARFIFLALLVILAFVANAFIYSAKYERAFEDWQNVNRTVGLDLERRADNLQEVANFPQLFVKPPSVLAFIAENGDDLLPNSLLVNTFQYWHPQRMNRGNDALQSLPSLDWAFIVNTVMSLLAILLGFGTVCGEKRDGTLKLVLANSLSRLSLFLGKYFGLMMVLLITFTIGVLINLGILSSLGVLTLEASVLQSIGWAILMSILTFSIVLLVSMAVSSMTAFPPVSLVVMVIIWVLFAVAVPGIAGLVGKGLVDVPNQVLIDHEIDAATDEAWANAAQFAGRWMGDPFADYVKDRADVVQTIVASRQRIRDAAIQKRIDQIRTVQDIATISPFSVFKSGLQVVCQTGIEGFDTLYAAARQYQQQMHSFTVERDRGDPETPHLVYSWGQSSDTGVFSRKPVETSVIPRSQAMWQAGGLTADRGWPAASLLILLIGNALAAIIAFSALARYDPR